MDSPEVFIAFGATMLVIALLGVLIDWFGKPLRHRKFVPKMYRFPDERQPRQSKVRQTEWSDASLVLPVVEAPAPHRLVRYPSPAAIGPGNGNGADPRALLDPSRLNGAPVDVGPPTTQVPVVPLAGPEAALVTVEDTEPEAALGEVVDDVEAPVVDDGPGSRIDRKRGWKLGGYVFNLTADGNEPSPTTVRTRYWKNVAATAGASIFGAANLERMARGKPPRRRNHRTGELESMRLPAVEFGDNDGQTPVPEWPSDEIDPFAPASASVTVDAADA